MTVHTAAPQFKADRKLLAYVERKLGRLTRVYDRVIDCSVTLRLENHGRVKDKVAEVKVLVPGFTIVAHDTQRTFEAAVDVLSDKVRRQLRRYKARR